MAPPAFHLQLAPLIESPALPGCCTCCLATCVISRLRRASVFGLRRLGTPTSTGYCTGCLATCVASRLCRPSVSSLRLQWNFNFGRLPHRLPYWWRNSNLLRISIPSRGRDFGLISVSNSGFHLLPSRLQAFQLLSKTVSPTEVVDLSPTSVNRPLSTQPSMNSQSRSNFLFAASRL
jgi:hypothetical protein